MLGVRREAVNKAAIGLQIRHIISYVRGNMSILDRKELEANVCNCYRFILAGAQVYRGLVYSARTTVFIFPRT